MVDAMLGRLLMAQRLDYSRRRRTPDRNGHAFRSWLGFEVYIYYLFYFILNTAAAATGFRDRLLMRKFTVLRLARRRHRCSCSTPDMPLTLPPPPRARAIYVASLKLDERAGMVDVPLRFSIGCSLRD